MLVVKTGRVNSPVTSLRLVVQGRARAFRRSVHYPAILRPISDVAMRKPFATKYERGAGASGMSVDGVSDDVQMVGLG